MDGHRRTPHLDKWLGRMDDTLLDAPKEDAACIVYFSKREDFVKGICKGMDAGDALIVIGYLCEKFGLNKEVVAESCGKP